MHRALLLSLVLVLAAPALARPMMHIRVDDSDAALGELAALRASLVGGGRGYVDAYLVPDDLWQLHASGIEYEIIADDTRDEAPPTRDDYHDSLTVEEDLEALVADYPELARMVDVGDSVQGRPIVGVILGADVLARTARPSMRLLGAHHGDEWSSMEVSIEVAHALVEGYGADLEITALLDGCEVWVVPLLNPDGLESFQRYNANDVDLNRNYAYEWSMWEWASGDGPFSEPETDAVRAQGVRRSFSHAASYHSGAVLCNYLWNYTEVDSPDEGMLAYMCGVYEAATTAPDFYSTNGAAWYITHGDSNDWAYGVRGALEYTLELTADKAPPEEHIPGYVDWHLDASLLFLEEGARTGVAGQVVDADSGVPVEARLTSQPSGWPVYADPDTGAFHKLLFQGVYDLLVEAPGYEAATVSATVSDGALGTLDVALERQVPGVTLEQAIPSVLDLDGPAVQLRLVGSGLGGWAAAAHLHRWDADPLPLGVFTDGADLLVEVDPGDMEPEYSREGPWWIVVEGPGGEVALPRGLTVVGGGDPSFEIEGVTTVLDAGGPGIHRVSVQGDLLPRGADLLLVGPGGHVAWPVQVELEDSLLITALFDGAALPDGTWDVILAGGAHHRAVDDALFTEDGAFTDEPPADDDDTTGDDDSTGDDDTAADDDSTGGADDDAMDDSGGVSLTGQGCECRAGAGAGSWSAVVFLAAAAVATRRRR